MATSINQRQVGRLQQVLQHPQLIPKDVAFWSPPGGVDYLSRASRIDPKRAYDALNWVIIDGRLEPRRPVATLGTAVSSVITLGGSNICEVGIFVTKDSFIHIFRMTQQTIEYWNGTNWLTPTGVPTLTGGITDHLSYTAWNNRMVWTNGKDGLYEWNWATNTITTISTAYIPRMVTTFMSRIFLADVLESGAQLQERMRWSVKNNNMDLNGLGSGFEDFLSTPGGYVDQIQSIVPVNDVQALAIRENSTWVVSETGNVDAPVRIGRQFAGLGTNSPRSIVSVTGGALGLFVDGIYVVSESGVQNIGQQIIRRIQDTVVDFDSCVGSYNNDLKRYSLSVFDENIGRSIVYQYSFPDQSWMPHKYPFRITSMQYAQSPLVGLTIDSSPGTFDAATGSIDSEVGSAESSHVYFGGYETVGQYFVYNEADFSSFTVLPIEGATLAQIATGLIQAESPLRKTHLLEVQIEYESAHSLQGLIEYSVGTAGPWLEYSVQTLSPTDGPRIARFSRVITGHNIQLRFSVSLFNSQFKLLAFVPSLVQGALVNP